MSIYYQMAPNKTTDRIHNLLHLVLYKMLTFYALLGNIYI